MKQYNVTLPFKVLVSFLIPISIVGFLYAASETHLYKSVITIFYCFMMIGSFYFNIIILSNRIIYRIDEEKIEFDEDFLFFNKKEHLYFKDISGIKIKMLMLLKWFGLAYLYAQDGELKYLLAVGVFPSEFYTNIIQRLPSGSIIEIDPAFHKLGEHRKIGTD